MREQVLAFLETGVAAAAPGSAVSRAMPDLLRDPLDRDGCWHVIAVGKAARAMAVAALEALSGTVTGHVLVVTNAGNDSALDGVRVLRAGHPEPDEDGLRAAEAVAQVLQHARPQDRVLALISGGGSAMLPAPVPGLHLDDLRRVNGLLLASGADITQVNLVRQALDGLKGGGWSRLSGAPLCALILSDVPGDDLRVVASGPTVAPIGTPAEAAHLCRQLGIWDQLSERVQQAMTAPVPAAAPPAQNILVGSNTQSVAAMVAAGALDGGVPLQGDVADCARALVAVVRDAAPGQALVFGGETTVQLKGDGMGGRNQELALRFACEARAAGLQGPWAFAAMGSDGRDGPGDAAGGLVFPDTLDRIRAAGIDPADALARNDSTPTLAAADGLIMTGASGTNVADLAVFLRPPA
ncbi:glycerate kinase [Paracoccus sp. (in: a-proteobacteria)]|uniref:glycerate kinase type-2 family protein n=1 Tax=Paracoccus sp. TaxID=267 RepID=UPI00396C67DD